MYFATGYELLYMSGHGIYVWLCYGLAATIFIIFALQTQLKHRRFWREKKNQIKLDVMEQARIDEQTIFAKEK